MALRLLSSWVFKCFKRVEIAGEWLTGAAGPVFITFAYVLIGGGNIIFCQLLLFRAQCGDLHTVMPTVSVIAPRLPLRIITVPICLAIAVNLLGHYYLACTVPPGFADDRIGEREEGWMWAPRRRGSASGSYYSLPAGNGDVVVEEGQSERLLIAPHRTRERRCKKCGGWKPERAHHCRICRSDVLKYDHHCPWINQCVGLRNERHFILFMAYFVLACFCYVALGYSYMTEAVAFMKPWPYWPQRTPFILIYILAGVLSLAVLVMLTWHLRLISLGETTVEGYDNDVYRRLAKERGERFINCYDLGWRRNLWLFFNLDEYSMYTLMLPMRVAPYCDGRVWAKREGYDGHGGIEDRDELTDEED